jgi:hypothetical protein
MRKLYSEVERVVMLPLLLDMLMLFVQGHMEMLQAILHLVPLPLILFWMKGQGNYMVKPTEEPTS